MPLLEGHKSFKSTSSSSKWSHFIKDKKVGEGTYATVYLGWAIPVAKVVVDETLAQDDTGEKDRLLKDQKVGDKATEKEGKRRIAIKKLKAGHFKDGMDMSAIREIQFLQELRHPNVIELVDVFSHKTNLNLVLEYLDADLEMIIKNKSVVFSTADVKSWMLMTLRGVHHCHRNSILHRDLKPNNLLLASDGQLKLADFGMARDYGNPHKRMTSVVVTRWYRAPELLLGATRYGYAIDMWAIGCIFAELMLRTPFMAGDTDIGQLQIIFKALGTPTSAEWPGMKELDGYFEFQQYPKPPLRSILTAAAPDALDLLDKLLSYEPLKRPTARDAVNHFYFRNLPRPTPPNKLPRDEGGAGAQRKEEMDVNPQPPPGGDSGASRKRKADEENGPQSKIARRLF
ncbi:kinase-like domain-containing protein [Phlyctochytrium arcticum]|nr:kinase-like domain-containing protein [Phlyctochytrium arcticum]